VKLSIVIPVYNGSSSIERLVGQLNSVLGDKLHEIIMVNDGSSDNSEFVCESILAHYKNVSLISLRKNFGEHNAVLCGLNFTSGDLVAIIDDDFQNPPIEILKLYDKALEGYDVVYSRYERKLHSLWRNLGSKFHNCVATYLLKKPSELYLSSFKIIRKEVVQEIIKYKGPSPYIDGLILRVTRNIGTCLVTHSAREEGRSNYTLKRLISLYLTMFLNFSILPLRLFTISGFIAFLVGSLFSISFILERIFDPTSTPSGWASIIISVLTLSGVQLIFLGLIGEYIGKMHLDLNGTPQWVIKKQNLASLTNNRISV
jgi:glycosyltransferase involved in cell wall biosynthesis